MGDGCQVVCILTIYERRVNAWAFVVDRHWTYLTSSAKADRGTHSASAEATCAAVPGFLNLSSVGVGGRKGQIEGRERGLKTQRIDFIY